MTAATVATAAAMELPPGAKGYYKDRVSSSPGRSEGVGPTEKPEMQKGAVIGRRETNAYDFSDESSEALSLKAFEVLNKKDEAGVLAYTSRCIELYEEKARSQNASLKDFASSGSEDKYPFLNDVAACYFIIGELYAKHKKELDKARLAHQRVLDDFYFGQYWDPRGWWWKVSEKSKGEIEKIDAGYYDEK
ncbi:MAG: hypothetical protein ABH843_03015 [Candidatus Omnitrophota bacterium]